MPRKTTIEPAAETPAQKSRRILAEEKANLRAAYELQTAAKDRCEDVTNALSAGKILPDGALAKTRADIEQANMTVAGAERRYKLAQRNVITDRPDLAESIAWALDEVLPFAVTPSTERPTQTTIAANEAPRLVVVQTKPSTQAGGGMLAGEVTLVFSHNADVHRDLDLGTLSKALDDAKVHMRHEPLIGAPVEVIACPPAGDAPFLPAVSVSSSPFQLIGARAVDRLCGPSNPYAEPPNINFSARGPRIEATVADVELLREFIDSAGIRTASMRGVVQLKPHRRALRIDEAVDALQRAAQTIVGEFHANLGRVVDVSFAGSPDRSARVTITFRSTASEGASRSAEVEHRAEAPSPAPAPRAANPLEFDPERDEHPGLVNA